MKKSVLTLLLATAGFTAQADVLLGGDVEMNAWQQDYTRDGSGNGDEMTYTFEASLEHPIPLVPNFKIAQSEVDANTIEYTKQDYTLYYEILDNDLVSFDVGAGVTSLQDGKLDALTFEGYIPHLYAAAELGIPATPLFLFAKGTGVSYSDNQMMDLSAGVQYSIGLGLVDIELQAGYRTQSFDLDGFDDLATDIDLEADGIFAGVNLDF
jgi:outer membrane protein